MRKDAEQNRDRLIAAASEIMRSEGGDVPMEVIAERAGVTRGTLYRNFAHRQAMYEAVLERDLSNLAKLIADKDDDPLAFIRHTAELMMVYDRFLGQLVDMPDYDSTKNQRRMADVLTAPLADAQQNGLLRADMSAADVLMACRMLASHWKLDDEAEFDRAFERRLALLVRGLHAERQARPDESMVRHEPPEPSKQKSAGRRLPPRTATAR